MTRNRPALSLSPFMSGTLTPHSLPSTIMLPFGSFVFPVPFPYNLFSFVCFPRSLFAPIPSLSFFSTLALATAQQLPSVFWAGKDRSFLILPTALVVCFPPKPRTPHLSLPNFITAGKRLALLLLHGHIPLHRREMG